LEKIKCPRYTARQLRGGRHAMVSRVQRKEDRRFYKNVQLKKEELSKQLLDLKDQQLPVSRLFSMQTIQPTLITNDSILPKRKLTRIESKRRLKGGRR